MRFVRCECEVLPFLISGTITAWYQWCCSAAHPTNPYCEGCNVCLDTVPPLGPAVHGDLSNRVVLSVSHPRIRRTITGCWWFGWNRWAEVYCRFSHERMTVFCMISAELVTEDTENSFMNNICLQIIY